MERILHEVNKNRERGSHSEAKCQKDFFYSILIAEKHKTFSATSVCSQREGDQQSLSPHVEWKRKVYCTAS